MAGVCPLCGEKYSQRELDGFPHICKAIPMPTIGQCVQCGTSMSDLNVSDMYPEICRGCANLLPGNRDEAIEIIAHKGSILLVCMPSRHWYIWVYVTGKDRMELDLLRRSYQGRVQHHQGNYYKWTCSTLKDVLVIGRDLHKMKYNPDLTADLLDYCRGIYREYRDQVAVDMLERWERKSIPIIPSSGGTQ